MKVDAIVDNASVISQPQDAADQQPLTAGRIEPAPADKHGVVVVTLDALSPVDVKLSGAFLC